MMYKLFTCTALAMMFLLNSVAQNSGEIQGKLFDVDGLPMIGVSVVATNGIETVGIGTGDDGKFRLKPLRAGTYNVTAIMMGFDTVITKGIMVKPDEVVFLKDQVMYEDTVSTGVIEIVYVPPHLDPTGGTVNYIGSADLEHNAAIGGGNINALLISMTPEIKASPDGEELYFRGSRAGSVIYFIDGVKYTGNNVTIPASGISSVAVYTGGLPAKYGDTTGGVVVVETKNYLQEYYRMLNQ